MNASSHLVVCVKNEGAEDLQILKVYRRLEDAVAEAKGFLRVIDDSGEDYLYPATDFVPLPRVRKPPDSPSDAEWLAEIERRARAAITGEPGLSWEEARARIRQRLAER